MKLPRMHQGYASNALAGQFGDPIDMARPKIQNPDGTFSTEETITIPRGGKWYNVPTIVNGQRMNPQDVENWFSQGAPNIPHVGEFGSMDEAVTAARRRTDTIGRVRETGGGYSPIVNALLHSQKP